MQGSSDPQVGGCAQRKDVPVVWVRPCCSETVSVVAGVAAREGLDRAQACRLSISETVQVQTAKCSHLQTESHSVPPHHPACPWKRSPRAQRTGSEPRWTGSCPAPPSSSPRLRSGCPDFSAYSLTAQPAALSMSLPFSFCLGF